MDLLFYRKNVVRYSRIAMIQPSYDPKPPPRGEYTRASIRAMIHTSHDPRDLHSHNRKQTKMDHRLSTPESGDYSNFVGGGGEEEWYPPIICQ